MYPGFYLVDLHKQGFEFWQPVYIQFQAPRLPTSHVSRDERYTGAYRGHAQK